MKRAAGPFAQELQQATSETVAVAVLDGSDIIYLDRMIPRSPIRATLQAGLRIPAAFTAGGRALLASHPDALLILVPRHQERFGPMFALCEQQGFATVRRSSGEPVTANIAIYIADTMNELGLFYRLPFFCFLGGTLVPMQGHNPLEPATLNCAILAGPSRANSARAFEAVLQAQGFGDVQTSVDIAREAERLLSDPQAARAAGAAAARGAATLSGAVEKTIAAIKNLLGPNARA